jgi:hypothetical protein
MSEWKKMKEHVMEQFLDNIRISVDVYTEAVMVSFKASSQHLLIENIPCHHSLIVLRLQMEGKRE